MYYLVKANNMRYNSLFLALFLLICSCSKSEQIKMDLQSKLGNGLYVPVGEMSNLYMPDVFTMQNSYIDEVVLYCNYYTDRISITKEGNEYKLCSQKHTNPTKCFDMYLSEKGFSLCDLGKCTQYEKQ